MVALIAVVVGVQYLTGSSFEGEEGYHGPVWREVYLCSVP